MVDIEGCMRCRREYAAAGVGDRCGVLVHDGIE